MPLRLHVPGLTGPDPAFDLPAAAARHVQVRRLQPGDALVLFDGQGGEWPAEVLQMRRQQVQVAVAARREVSRELMRHVTLALAVPHGDRMDALVEKATELGVVRICPLISERSVLRVADQRAERKREHWQAVAVAACEQSGRTHVPEVQALASLSDWLVEARVGGERWLLSPTATAGLPAQAPDRLTVLSGPEGGFSADEEAAALAAGFGARSLGPRILRADTAPLSVLAWVALSP